MVTVLQKQPKQTPRTREELEARLKEIQKQVPTAPPVAMSWLNGRRTSKAYEEEKVAERRIALEDSNLTAGQRTTAEKMLAYTEAVLEAIRLNEELEPLVSNSDEAMIAKELEQRHSAWRAQRLAQGVADRKGKNGNGTK